MEEIKSWAVSVCVAAICGSVLGILLPEGNYQKIFKYILNIFFLCVVASPLSEAEISFFKDYFEYKELHPNSLSENDFTVNSVSHIENQIIKDTSGYLRSEGIVFKDISININISENGSIDINNFTLYLESEDNIALIKEKVKQKIGIEPEIFVSGEIKNGNN